MKLTIEKLVYGGAGVGDCDGKKVFVPFAAPGDALDVTVTKDHGSYAEADIVDITQPASCRVKPPCPVFGICGGCQWQHISYDAQIEWKRRILIETLQRIGKIGSPHLFPSPTRGEGESYPSPLMGEGLGEGDQLNEIVLPTFPSPKQWYYRNRIQLHVDSKGRIGFYKPKSKEVVEFDECLIADERLNEQLKQKRSPPPSPSPIKGEGNATPSPLVGEGWGEGDRPHTRGFSLRLEEGPSFSQINTEQNIELKKVLIEWLSEVPHDSIMELYAGAGNFTFPVASIAKKIVASDIDGRAIHYARLRQQQEDMGNIEFICAPAHDAAKKFHGPCDVVLIDPPRKGCAESIDVIVGLKPGSILYISCDPATLARDIKRFCEFGYKLKRCLPVDMFPQTYHIESVSLLTY